MIPQLRMIALTGLLALCLGASKALAERVENLYTEAVLVPSQSAEERRVVAGVALQQVLQRVSGSQLVAQHPALQEAMSRAESLLESYHYETTAELMTFQGQPVQASRLIFKFSSASLDALLRAAQLPVWPANRPAILLWLVTEDEQGRKRLVLPTEPQALVQDLPRVTQALGLPINQPLFDLQDQIAVDAEALWRLDREAIRAASQRYQVDAVLVGRYSDTTAGGWLGSWALEHKHRQMLFDSQGETATALLQNGLQQVAGYLAGLYGVVVSDMPANALVLELRGVRGFADYRRSLDYLEGLTVISHVAPLALTGETVRLLVHVEGDTAVLMDTLALDKRMEVIKGFADGLTAQPGLGLPSLPGSYDNPLRFSWLSQNDL